MGGVDGRRIVDAVAEKADDMAAQPQRKDDATLLVGVDAGEQVDVIDLGHQCAVGKLLDLGAGEDAPRGQADRRGDMADDGGMIAGDDLEADARSGEACDRVARVALGWIGEHAEADERQLAFVRDACLAFLPGDRLDGDSDQAKAILGISVLKRFDPAEPFSVERARPAVDLYGDGA
jgi:hypothetical protein